jgi:hypothetical protein
MRYLRGRRLTPAHVMGTMAVFISLGGVSYGVATGSIDSREIKNNTIRSKDVRNNQISSADLRNNSATGKDVKNSSLTGADVKDESLTSQDIVESSLGQVPTANFANSAGTAQRALSAAAVDRIQVSGNSWISASMGQVVDVLKRGPFTLKGHCDNSGGNPRAIIKIDTTEDHSVMDGNSENEDFGPGVEPRVSEDLSNAGPAFSADNNGSPDLYSAVAPSGVAISGQDYVGVNLFGKDCVFGITALG